MSADNRIPVLPIFVFLISTFLMNFQSAWGADWKGPVPGPKDKCPVCGMFVAKYPDFMARVDFQDGSSAFFDGVKDLSKYLLERKKYGHKKARINSFYVTDYYSMKQIDGQMAFYVIGSDVYGPMGRELIPFEKEADAREFLKDHKGSSVLRFGNITLQIIRSLD